MFERFNLDEMEKHYQQDAEQLLFYLPEEYQFTTKELLPVISFTGYFVGSTEFILKTLNKEFPKSKIALGYLGGMFSCFCQDHDIPTKRHTDFLHAFFLCIFNEEGDNLANTFLYLYNEMDEETYKGINEGMVAYENMQEKKSEAFMSFALL